MRYKYKCVFIFLKISCKPCYMFGIKIVCRLVKKENVRLLKKEFSEKYLGSLSSRKFCNIPIKTKIKKPESSCDFFYFRIDKIKIMIRKKLLYSSDFFHEVIHFILAGFAHFHIDFIHSFFHSKKRLECTG